MDSMPPASLHFVISPMLHSESLADQDAALAVNDEMAKRAPDIAKFARPSIVEHRDVIVRFGRDLHQ